MFTAQRPNDTPRWKDPAPATTARSSARVDEIPVPGNVNYLWQLGEDEYFELHGIPWRVPPVPAIVGAKLYELKARIHNTHASEQTHALTAEEMEKYTATLHEVTALMSSCLHPIRRRDKLLRRFRLWRPLRNASDADLGLLLDFLLALRGKSTIRRFPAAHEN